MPWKPAYPGEVPTLGFNVISWMAETLAAPDRTGYEPFDLSVEQAQFVIDLYALDPRTGRRRYRRGVISRPKGWGKSPLLSALAAAEAIADVVPDGWDADGRPVGKPWSEVRTPWVQIAAVSEDQTKNAWTPLQEMLTEGPACDLYPGLEPMETFVALPKGRIEYVTSAATSREGNRPVFSVLDQTESWTTTNGGVRLAATMRRNLGKTGGCSVEAPNAFLPGEGSVAEQSAEYWSKILERKVRDAGLLYDHREAPPATDLTDRASLRAGLEHAYGDSADIARCVIHDPPCRRPGWVDLDRIIAEIWDPATHAQDARRYYLNQITHASDQWVTSPELKRRITAVTVGKREPVVLGFDGSRHREDGPTDATSLVGVRVADGHLFNIRLWEEPAGPPGQTWRVPALEVDTAVAGAFRDFNIVGFFADPNKWESYIAQWEATYGHRLKVKSSAGHPIEWWPTDSRMIPAVQQLHTAIIEGEMTYDGSPELTRHFLNARRRPTRGGMIIDKAYPDSPRKIDAAVASMIAWQARLEAVARLPKERRSGVYGDANGTDDWEEVETL